MTKCALCGSTLLGTPQVLSALPSEVPQGDHKIECCADGSACRRRAFARMHLMYAALYSTTAEQMERERGESTPAEIKEQIESRWSIEPPLHLPSNTT